MSAIEGLSDFSVTYIGLWILYKNQGVMLCCHAETYLKSYGTHYLSRYTQVTKRMDSDRAKTLTLHTLHTLQLQ